MNLETSVNRSLGRYAVLEGGDLSGKSTQIKKIVEKLGNLGYSWLRTAQPSSADANPFAALARSMYMYPNKDISQMIAMSCLASDELRRLDQDASEPARYWVDRFIALVRAYPVERLSKANFSLLLQLAMLLDRRWHYDNFLVPNLRKGNNVISDRSLVSGLAYFHAEDGDPKRLLQAHLDILGDDFVLPNAIIYLEVSTVCFERRKKIREAKDYFEKKEKFEKVIAGYEAVLPLFLGVHRVNADLSEEEVFHRILEHFLPAHG